MFISRSYDLLKDFGLLANAREFCARRMKEFTLYGTQNSKVIVHQCDDLVYLRDDSISLELIRIITCVLKLEWELKICSACYRALHVHNAELLFAGFVKQVTMERLHCQIKAWYEEHICDYKDDNWRSSVRKLNFKYSVQRCYSVAKQGLCLSTDSDFPLAI